MYKIVIVLLVALVFESIGVVFLKKGIGQIGEMRQIAMPEIARLVKSGATNPNIWIGMVFETLFFFGLLYMMSKADISFVWPMTALGFVITPMAAHFMLREEITSARWAGIVLIVAGAGLISWSEHHKVRPPDTAAVAAAADSQPTRD